jgi:hypothetical protein
MNSKEYKLLKNNKSFALIFFVFTLLINCSELKKQKKTQIKQENSWINFEWVGDSISGKYFDKIAINIPFSIEGIPHKFKSQLDLGASSTMVYENSIKPYLNKYSDISKKLDTIIKVNWTSSGKVSAFNSISFKLDTVLFENQKLVHYDGYGDKLTKDSIETKTIKHIGTIGADLFQNKYLFIDFPNHRIAILDSLNTFYKERTNFVDAKLDYGRIKIPVTINGNIKYFMFDTGSSIIPLCTTKEDIKLVSNSRLANDTLNVSSWGEYYDIHGYTITSNISIGDFKIETQGLNVYDSKEEFKQFYIEEEIMGIMGNAFFIDKKIIIDYKNKKFGIIN